MSAIFSLSSASLSSSALLSVYDDSDSEGTNIGGVFFGAVDGTMRFLTTVPTSVMALAPSATPLLSWLPDNFPFRLFLAGVYSFCAYLLLYVQPVLSPCVVGTF
jgi:nitrous oxidase accessory protein NosD